MTRWTHADTIRQAALGMEPSRDEARRLLAAVRTRRRRQPATLWLGVAAGVGLACTAVLAGIGLPLSDRLADQRTVTHPEPQVCLVWFEDGASSSPLEVVRDPVCEPLAG